APLRILAPWERTATEAGEQQRRLAPVRLVVALRRSADAHDASPARNAVFAPTGYTAAAVEDRVRADAIEASGSTPAVKGTGSAGCALAWFGTSRSRSGRSRRSGTIRRQRRRAAGAGARCRGSRRDTRQVPGRIDDGMTTRLARTWRSR